MESVGRSAEAAMGGTNGGQRAGKEVADGTKHCEDVRMGVMEGVGREGMGAERLEFAGTTIVGIRRT